MANDPPTMLAPPPRPSPAFPYTPHPHPHTHHPHPHAPPHSYPHGHGHAHTHTHTLPHTLAGATLPLLASSSTTSSASSAYPATPRSVPITPYVATSPATFAPDSATATPTGSGPACSRPKAGTKKLSASKTSKHKAVQLALEAKVDRAKGFHAFFVPLARPLPDAPPSSPVLHPQHPPQHQHQQRQQHQHQQQHLHHTQHQHQHQLQHQHQHQHQHQYQHQHPHPQSGFLHHPKLQFAQLQASLSSRTDRDREGYSCRDYFGKWQDEVAPKGNQQWVEDVDDGMQLDSD